MAAKEPSTEIPPLGPSEAPPLVDTPEARDALACPLCRYSLRGLARVERPQCPECGYRFEWGELLAARQYSHLFLFEHHPRRNFTSFFWTLLAGLFPRRFWSSLNAGHAIRTGRLYAYHVVIVLTVLLTGVVGSFVTEAITLYRRSSGSMVVGANWVYVGPTLDLAFLRQVADDVFDDGTLEPFLIAVALAWPWLTLAALLLFQVSMRRAKIGTAHVVRVVVYCGDAFIWTGVVFGLIGVLRWMEILSRSHMWDDVLAVRQAAVAFLLIVIVATWRVGVAYRRYLRFDHPWATVLAAQVVVVLVVTTLLTWLYDDFWKLLPRSLT